MPDGMIKMRKQSFRLKRIPLPEQTKPKVLEHNGSLASADHRAEAVSIVHQTVSGQGAVHIQVQIEALEAAKLAAAAIVKNSRYMFMLMSVVMATNCDRNHCRRPYLQHHQPCAGPSLTEPRGRPSPAWRVWITSACEYSIQLRKRTPAQSTCWALQSPPGP
jgi:hypothetical protein